MVSIENIFLLYIIFYYFLCISHYCNCNNNTIKNFFNFVDNQAGNIDYDAITLEINEYTIASPFEIFSIEKLNSFLNFTKNVDIENICVQHVYSKDCLKVIDDVLYKYSLIDPNIFTFIKNKIVNETNEDIKKYYKNLKKDISKYNTLLSYLYVIKGDINYYGIYSSIPDILSGLELYIIAGYIGNSKAFYKLYILLETNTYLFYYKKLQENIKNINFNFKKNIKRDNNNDNNNNNTTIILNKYDNYDNSIYINNMLNYILLKNNFLNNFEFDSNPYYTSSDKTNENNENEYQEVLESNGDDNIDLEKNSIANLMLYNSAIYKDISALSTLGYKYFKGYGAELNCEASKKYYSEAAYNIISYYHRHNKPNYYEKSNLCANEYVGYKFSSTEGGSSSDISHVIEYFKMEANKGMISHINHLGQRYLYGQGVEQDFKESLYYFKKGAELNDTTSIFYLGEQFLHGYGVEKNYTKALELFSKCEKLGYYKALNSLGFMHYYGYGVDKNIKVAYDYIIKSVRLNPDDMDTFYNYVTLLTEDNGGIKVDVQTAHKYANIVASKGHTFGSYYFASMNNFKLGAVVDSCIITNEFYRAVSERSLESKRKYDLATKAYHSGNYKMSSLLFLELAEEGQLSAEINAGVLFNNYKIFIDKKFNKEKAFQYFKRSSIANSAIGTLYLADMYYIGNEYISQNYTKAYEYYKKVQKLGLNEKSMLGHAYYNTAVMNGLGYGVEKNNTRFDIMLNKSLKYEPNLFIPVYFTKAYVFISSNEFDNLISYFVTFIISIYSPVFAYIGIFIILFYLFFLRSLKVQI